MPPVISLATYEGQLLGWSVQSGKDGITTTLEYAFSAADEPVRCMAAHGKTLAVAAGEIINIFDLNKRRQTGSLLHHTDTVTAVLFAGSGSLLSADEGGTICFWDTSNWTPLLSVKGHKSRIADVAIHPSNKVALSAGVDGTCRLWDLTKGKPVHTVKVQGEPAGIMWSPSGDSFYIMFRDSISCFDGSCAKLSHSWQCKERLCQMTQTTIEGKHYVVGGTEDGHIVVCKAGSEAGVRISPSGLTGRVKRVAVVEVAAVVGPSTPSSSSSLSSGSNSGSGKPSARSMLVCVMGNGKVALLDAVAACKSKDGADVDVLASLGDAVGVRPTALACHR